MNTTWLVVVVSCLACVACVVLAQSDEAYCYRNETVTTYEEVTKSRYVKEKTGWLRKTKTVKVDYKETVPKTTFKTIRECCEGYKTTPIGLCVPICLDDCPPHAECIQPNTCQCERHYIARVSPVDGSHLCEPHCQHPCPEHSRCVEPNKCHCDHGYTLTATNVCVPKCDSASCQPAEQSTPLSEVSEFVDETTVTNTEDSSYSSEEEEDDVNDSESDHDDEDGDDFVSNLDSLEDSSEGPTKCPSGFIHYKGECRPLIFASNEKDCRYHACPEYAQCMENGTCACIDGFWLQPVLASTESSTSEEEATTLWDDADFGTTEQTPQLQGICVKITELLAESEEKKVEPNGGDSNWMSAFFIAFGLACIACAAVFLGVKLLRHRHGQMDVEAKNDMRCEYDSREVNEKPMVY